MLTLHRLIGVLVWLVTPARLGWKANAAQAPAPRHAMPRWQRWAARANEIMLYPLLIVQPATGLVQSIARVQNKTARGRE